MGCSNEINTQLCTSSSNCPQVGAYVSCGTGCNCGCSPCQCGQSGSAAPTPYYNQAPGVEECHKQVVVQQSFVTALSTVSAFNMPACNGTAVITVPGLFRIQVGSYLWNVNYGYLLVLSFDYVNQQITVKNECQGGNAAPGTLIPACTMFNIADPPCECASGQYGVFVATDFVAPANGNCLDIQVTGVAGLTAGANVQIGSGIYLLAGIVSSTIINICNNGSGVTPGTVIVAKDGTGQYITPVTPLSSNACNNAVQAQGSILTCHNGVQAPLDAAMVGQIPVVVDASTNEVQFQTVQLPTTVCTTMTSCLNLFIGITSYTVIVNDSSVFNVGDIVIIYVPGYETVRWTVTGKPSATQLTINRTTAQTINDTIGCDTAQICLAPCCEQITGGSAICASDWSSAFKTVVSQDSQDRTDTLPPPQGGSNLLQGLPAYVIFENTTCNYMKVHVTYNYYFKYSFTNVKLGADSADIILWTYTDSSQVLIGSAFPAPTWPGFFSLIEGVTFAGCDINQTGYRNVDFTRSTGGSLTFTVSPGYKLRVAAETKVEYVDFCGSQTSTGDMVISLNESVITGIGVADQEAPVP